MRILWDEPKRRQNRAKHGLDFSAVAAFDWANSVVVSSRPGVHGGQRLKAIGILDGDLVAIVFASLGTEAISIISLRRASRAERRLYDGS
jgi:uncharacterized DUF497 family protein